MVDILKTSWNPDNDIDVYLGPHSFKVEGKDVTARFPKGARIRYKQGGAYEYGVVNSATFSTDTTVTLVTNDDYALANDTITDNYYSYASCPQGYPVFFNWTPVFTGFSVDPTGIYRFSLDGSLCRLIIRMTANGTSDTTGFTMTGPCVAKNIGNYLQEALAAGCVDNSVALTTGVNQIYAGPNTNVLIFQKSHSPTGWTATGGKRASTIFSYEIE